MDEIKGIAPPPPNMPEFSPPLATLCGSSTPTTTINCHHCLGSFACISNEDFRDHVAACAKFESDGVSSTLSSPPDSPRIKTRVKNLEYAQNIEIGVDSADTDISHEIQSTDAGASQGNEFNPILYLPSDVNSKSKSNDGSIDITTYGATVHSADLPKGIISAEDIHINRRYPKVLSAYIPGEVTYYDTDIDDEVEPVERVTFDDIAEGQETPRGSQELNDVNLLGVPSLGTPMTAVSPHAETSELNEASEAPTPSVFRDAASTGGNPTHFSSQLPDPLELSKQIGTAFANQVANEQEYSESIPENNTTVPKTKRRAAFKKIVCLEDIVEYLKDPELMTIEELSEKTAVVASILVELQDEAASVEKELSDFETSRKATIQINMEQAKLAREQAIKEDDLVFERLLKKYGKKDKITPEEWANFHENFFINNPNEDSEDTDCHRLMLQLRNPQFVGDFNKRQVLAERLKIKTQPVQKVLANTIYAPPSKAEQKAAEESDKRKRRPAIDPLIFEDRKQAGVYGFTYKPGESFMGNQPLKDLKEASKEGYAAKQHDENSRPKRTRGKRSTYDTDQSDHTPAVSDEEDALPAKRVRTAKVIDDSPANSTRVRAKTAPQPAPQSRDSTPGAAPKVFASGKRVGRPPGSKTKAKAPSKLKSVQAAVEAPAPVENNLPSQALTHTDIDGTKGTCDKVVPSEETKALASSPKKKHAGGRPRKHLLPQKSQGNPELASKAKSKGGRPRKHPLKGVVDTYSTAATMPPPPKAKKVSKVLVGLNLNNEVLQSTEMDDEFLSAASSRPSTSSSADTVSSFDTTRQTRSFSKDLEPANHNYLVTSNTRGRRRKQAAAVDTMQEDPVDSASSSKKPKTGTAPQFNTINSDPSISTGFSAHDLSSTPSNNAEHNAFQDRHVHVLDLPALWQGKPSGVESLDATSPKQRALAPKVASPSHDVSKPEVSEISNTPLIPLKVKSRTIGKRKGIVDSESSRAPVAKRSRDPTAKKQALSSFEVLNRDASTDGNPPPTKQKLTLFIVKKNTPNGEISGYDPSDEGVPSKRARTVTDNKNRVGSTAPNLFQEDSNETDDTSPRLKKRHRIPTNKASTKSATPVSDGDDNVNVNSNESGNTTPLKPKKNARASSRKRFDKVLTTAHSASVPVAAPAPAALPMPIPAIEGIRKSVRAHKPSRRAQGMDGAADQDDADLHERFRSEYDRFQALASPGNTLQLGKRQRKSRIDLSYLKDEFNDEDEQCEWP